MNLAKIIERAKVIGNLTSEYIAPFVSPSIGSAALAFALVGSFYVGQQGFYDGMMMEEFSFEKRGEFLAYTALGYIGSMDYLKKQKDPEDYLIAGVMAAAPYTIGRIIGLSGILSQM